MKRKVLPLLFAALLLLAGSALAAGNPFTDVKESDYFYDAVQWAVESGVTTGTTPTTFSPGAVCTRGQVATFLWRAKGKPEPASLNNPFSDVLPSSPFFKAILWAAEQGITSGYADGTFKPGAECTCAHIITFLWRASDAEENGASSPLTENFPADAYYTAAVSWADFTGLLEETGFANPNAPCTRAMTAQWLYGAAAEPVQITVSNMEEFAAAIGSNRVVMLEPGTYNVTEWIKAHAGSTGNDALSVEQVFDGRELRIRGVKNLTITGGGAGEVSIVAEPRYADVLSFYGSTAVTISAVTLGHTPEQGSCEGGVLYFSGCGDVTLDSLDLYGCGTYGVEAETVDTLMMYNSNIRDCSYGIMRLVSVGYAEFYDCVFRNCREFDMLEILDTMVEFNECTFRDNSWSDFFGFLTCSNGAEVFFNGCTLDAATQAAIESHELFNKSVFILQEANSFSAEEPAAG